MKKTIFLLLIISTLHAYCQTPCSVETRALTSALRDAKGNALNEGIMKRLAVTNDGSDMISVLALVDDAFSASAATVYGIQQSSRIGNIVTLRMPLSALPHMQSLKGVSYYSLSHRVEPEMDNTRVDTRTDSVQQGYGVPMPFDGTGVLIGITDWGFDYTHPNINPKNTPRILRAWDHFRTSGPAPSGFSYGTEIVGDSALRAAHGDTSNIYGYGTHGTHVAGICGGRGKNGHAIGQAPGAQYLLGTFALDEASWLDQVAWMRSVAQQENKRLVINSSWGMYTFSTLDGTSILSQAINAYADSGVVFVTSGGNNGDATYHLHHSFASNDTLRSIARYLGSGVGQALIYWGEANSNHDFSVGFALVRNDNNNDITYSPLFSTADNCARLDSFIVAGNDTIRFDIMTEHSNYLDHRPHALLNVSKSPAHKLMMICTADSAVSVHVWNIGNQSNNAGNTGCDFAFANVPGCLNGNTDYGIGEPACADKTLSVAAHQSDRYYHDTVYQTGHIAYFSSHGPTLDGRNKPEISAPGYNVTSSISSWCDNIDGYEALLSTVSNGRRYIWSSMSGTSMSSPAVTGIVALMLQANPNLTFDEIRQIITTNARNDDKTGPLRANDSISPVWGYGKIDALRCVNAAYDRLSIDEAITRQPDLVVFPNPSTSTLTLRTGTNDKAHGSIFSVDGRQMMDFTVTSETTLDISSLPQGLYIVRLQDSHGVRVKKIMKL